MDLELTDDENAANMQMAPCRSRSCITVLTLAL
jgi:hypothetical protein